MALLGSAKRHVICKDIKHSCYDYNDAKNFVDHNIVTLERLIITTGEESRKKWKFSFTSQSEGVSAFVAFIILFHMDASLQVCR